MYLKYGSYQHESGECQLAIDRRAVFNDRMIAWAIRERWTITGILQNQTGVLSTMQTSIASLKTAYDTDGLDLTLHLDDDSETQHKIATADCLGGTKVIQRPSFPTNREAEGVNYTTYTVIVEGLVKIVGETLRSFHEFLTFTGGGPRYGHIETLIGLPVKQKPRNYTIYRVEQAGEAVGLYAYPTPPDPIWPAALVEAGRVKRRSPKRTGSEYYDYPVSWRYAFEAAGALLGQPTKWT